MLVTPTSLQVLLIAPEVGWRGTQDRGGKWAWEGSPHPHFAEFRQSEASVYT